MKSPKILLVLLILFASVHICFGQEKSASVLFDEFGAIPCDEFLARLDVFFVELGNNPTATGYVIINGKQENERQSFRYRGWIRGWTKIRRFDSSRMTIIRGENSEELKIRFWLTPAGANLPDSPDLGWKSPSIFKPRIFYSEYDGDGICPGDILISFSEILTQQLDVRGHIVINAKSVKDFNERKKELISEFSEIPSSRLRFFHVRHSSDAYVEYWLVPAKKRN